MPQTSDGSEHNNNLLSQVKNEVQMWQPTPDYHEDSHGI